MFKPMRMMFKLICCVTLGAVPCVTALGNALPPNTMAVLKLQSLNQINDQWNAFMNAASPIEFNISLQDYILDPFNLQSADGIDSDQPIWGFYWHTNDQKSHYGILYPVAEANLFKDQLPEADQPDVIVAHDYALLTKAGKGELLEEWFLGETAMDGFVNLLHDNHAEIQLWADFEKINQVYHDELTAIDQETHHNEEAYASTAWTQSMIELGQQLKTVFLTTNINQELISVQKRLTPVAETDMAAFVQDYKPSDIKPLLAAYQPDSVLFAYLNANSDIVQNLIDQFWQSIHAELVQAKNQAQEIPSQEITEQDTQIVGNGTLAYMVELTRDLDDPYRFNLLQSAQNEDDVQLLYDRLIEMSLALKENKELGNQLKIDQEAGTIGDTPYAAIQYSWTGLDPEEEMEASFWGNELALYASTFQNLMLLTNGDLPQLVKRLENASKREFQEDWPSAEDRAALAGVRINLIEILRGVQMHLNKTSPGFNPMLVIKIPEIETAGITLRSVVEDEQIQTRLLIPSEEINTLFRVITNDLPIDRTSRSSKKRGQ